MSVVFPDGYDDEPYEAVFALWEGYGCESLADAHATVLWLLARRQPAVVLDHQKGEWEFHRETVRSVVVWEQRGRQLLPEVIELNNGPTFHRTKVGAKSYPQVAYR